MNPMGSILVPVAVTTKGHLSLVSLSFKDSKILRLMQLLVAPISYMSCHHSLGVTKVTLNIQNASSGEAGG